MEWIKVELPLPELGETVLLDLGGKDYCIGWLIKVDSGKIVFRLKGTNPPIFVEISRVKRWMAIDDD